MSFVQAAAELGNQYRDDRVLRSHLQRCLPAPMRDSIAPELDELGAHAALAWQRERGRSACEPQLTPWDSQGNRIDRIELTPAWIESRGLAARLGLVAAGHEDTYAQHGRTHQFALVYLHHVASAFFTCPLAMTDGAATCIKAAANTELLARAWPRWLSRDPEQFWISGQWMTETPGGSDVGNSETEARQDATGQWRLYGRKWFTSAVQADTALALARPAGAGPGAESLSLFYLEPRDAQGRWQGVQINRLKPKLGTRELPSAETELVGIAGTPVNGIGHGVRSIAPMLNVTRSWNAVCAIATLRRALALARDYATRRRAFGKLLAEQPLHQATLADLQADFEAAFQLTFEVVGLLGRAQHDQASDDERLLLRLLTPLAKLWTGKLAVAITSEAIECFGGAGYIEDSGLPQLLRDAQVLPIWEGTTNVLSLDVLRVLRQPAALDSWRRALDRLLDAVGAAELKNAAAAVRTQAMSLPTAIAALAAEPARLEAAAREIALALARHFAAALLLRQGDWSLRHEGDPRTAAAARRFIGRSRAAMLDRYDDAALLVLER
ncbi:alkylation response protein AidB-like acyl-CoA dehydrogenase [Tahibacter aquaticus]|uniref:Alkylation response protein AidB-like acyl-CoA dehydrogenase n=1 Tax=Tahibacter aquaticus TaxID=520092 RepID=A0A4R6Z9K1_9GAMM|nr:acyl-CoA dehydrogenase family protein [Tahibacter aquaticus]TDR48583.1 alkylation response protein AidB-like acyl-CoA dehydrogenase [Tahibacter aquaticus]